MLIITSTGVSFSHGSNDGQKGVGLVMMILIAFAPAYFALDIKEDPAQLLSCVKKIESKIDKIDIFDLNNKEKIALHFIDVRIDTIKDALVGIKTFYNLPDNKTFKIRKDILLVAKTAFKIIEDRHGRLISNINRDELESLKSEIATMKTYTEYAPSWVIFMISLSLGLGTMIGWKRIVVTIGEKIGKTNLNYAQGASAQIVAASTIGISSWLGLPVSTTHVLSSGIAGSMVSGGGMKNLQFKTVTNIAIAWLITLPITILLSGSLFLLFRMVFI